MTGWDRTILASLPPHLAPSISASFGAGTTLRHLHVPLPLPQLHATAEPYQLGQLQNDI